METLTVNGLIFLNSQFSLMEPVISFWMFNSFCHMETSYLICSWFIYDGNKCLAYMQPRFKMDSKIKLLSFYSVRVFEWKTWKSWENKAGKFWINGFNIKIVSNKLIKDSTTPTREQCNFCYITFLPAVKLLNHFCKTHLTSQKLHYF